VSRLHETTALRRALLACTMLHASVCRQLLTCSAALSLLCFACHKH
jgi:hypothetical protein